MHRYNNLYLPVQRFFSRLPPQTRLYLFIIKLALVSLLVGLELAYASHLI